jgi:hypothetical protein
MSTPELPIDGVPTSAQSFAVDDLLGNYADSGQLERVVVRDRSPLGEREPRLSARLTSPRSLGEAMAEDAAISADAHLYEKCEAARRPGSTSDAMSPRLAG